MANIEIAALTEHLSDDEIKTLARSLIEVVSDDDVELPLEGESLIVEHGIDDDVLVDFQDRLEANDAHATVYLPIEFEEVFEIGEHRVGSIHALMLVLDNLKEDFYVSEEDEFEEDMDNDGTDDFDMADEESVDYYAGDASPTEMKDGQLRSVWHALNKGANLSEESGLCLYLRD